MSRSSVLTSLSDEEGNDSTAVESYTVQEGDTLSEIANGFGLKVQTLLTANNISNPNAIKPGVELRIPATNGIFYTVKKGDTVGGIAAKYKAESEQIISFNSLPLSGDLHAGQEIIIPDGVAPSEQRGSTKVQDVSKNRFLNLPQTTGYFVAMANCTITQLVHGFNGVDCAAPVGTPIYASAAGTIETAKYEGYNGGYGKFVRIKHSNGMTTLYGHMSKVLVEPGQSVVQGQQIGLVGNTGRSTGPHVHFEIRGGANILAKYGKGAHVVAGK